MSAWLLMPLLAAAVGGLTNWLAVWVTLYPARPIGIGGCRWMGLIPRKAERVVGEFVDRVLPDVVSQRELMQQVDPLRVADDAMRRLAPQLDGVIESTLSAVNPAHWQGLRPPVRAYWVAQLRPGIPRIVATVLQQVQAEPERYIDLHGLLSAQVRETPGLLSEVLWRTGRTEFRFIEWSGALLGALMGLLMAAVWLAWPTSLVAALGGGIVGGVTNFLALKMVFAQPRCRRVGGFRIQGLIYLRQHEVSALLADSMLDRLVRFGAMLEYLATHSEAFRHVCRRAIEAELARTSGGAATLVMLALGARSTASAVDAMVESMVRDSPALLGQLELGTQDRAAVHRVLADKMRALSPQRYGQMMRFMVAEEEPLLIAAGVVLGALGAWIGVGFM